ncbi:50S ribosomal protein L11 methyltransferase [Bradyrhizobium uaiense]|uniref:Methyltransferase n=1 Tax=Bradyrhizobium uaiense TaxID=2594946 RepID=A0A6P1BJD8_9BRAD|nr:50S ribosomal protein L11 methyltransferase [Bradyrhizobium uaiense]NEU98319.1 methyltransferase [Bradyrhizobium uaiense]
MTATLTVSPRRQTSDVDAMIADLRSCEHPHDVEVCGMLLHILPGVLSPRLSHAPDALISKWHIPSGATVLDLGCGSGVLGLAALRAGAERLVALDINPQAVLTTKTNIERLGYSDHAEVRLSDIYSALQPKEKCDVILFAAPYWNRKAKDDLERSCFDEGHSAMAAALGGAHNWLKADSLMYVVFSDQGDIGRVLNVIDDSKLRVRNMHIFRPSIEGGHIRIIWELTVR